MHAKNIIYEHLTGMQVSNIQPNLNINLNQPIKNKDISSSAYVSPVNFRGNITKDCADFALTRGLNKIKNFTVSEYKTLTPEELAKLRKTYQADVNNEKDYYKKLEYLHEFTASKIKKYCDKKYGEGKYNVITIGRSLSSVGKLLGYKIGENRVINIPLSDANQYVDKNTINYLKTYTPDVKNFTKFLKDSGLSKHKIGKSKEKYIIMDYCSTGASLEGATKLLTDKDVLGKKNIESLDVKKCVKDYADADRLEVALFTNSFKPFAGVGRAESLAEVPNAAKMPESTEISKLFRFKLLDNEMSKSKIEKSIPEVQSFFKTLWKKVFDK